MTTNTTRVLPAAPARSDCLPWSKTRSTISCQLALAIFCIVAMPQLLHAQQVVVLPGVVGPVGQTDGVETQGPGLLTVGNQNINTQNVTTAGITTDAADTASILFTGSSTVNGFVGETGSTFLRIDAGANNNTVTFNGQVFSTTLILTGTGTVNFNGGFVSLTGSVVDFAGDGFMTLGATQTLRGAITNTAGAQTGTLTLGAGSIVDGAVGAASGLREIRLDGGNALITGQSNSYTYTLGTNTLNVGGAFAIPVAGTINTTIFSDTIFGHIVPVGAATIGDNLLVNVTVTGAISDGAEFNIVDATSGTDGSTVTTTSNSPLYEFSADPTVGGQVKLITVKLPAADVVDGTPGASPNVRSLAMFIDGLPLTNETRPLLDALVLLPTAEALAGALAQLGPGAASINAPTRSSFATQRFQDRIASHLDMCMFERAEPTAPPDGVDCDEAKRWWVSGLRSTGSQDSRDGHEGYETRMSGILIGHDFPVMEDYLRAGLAFGYARSSLDGMTFDNESDIDSYQGTLYLGHAPGPWFSDGGVTIGTDRYSHRRRVAFPGFESTTESDHGGMQYGAFANAGHRLDVGEGTVVTPSAGLRYTHLRAGSYTESGGQGNNLRVGSQSYNVLQSRLGAKATHDVGLSSTVVLRPRIHAYWLQALGNSTMKNTAAFTAGGPAFEVSDAQPSRASVNVGASATLLGNTRWSLEGGYDLHAGRRYTSHEGSLSLIASF